MKTLLLVLLAALPALAHASTSGFISGSGPARVHVAPARAGETPVALSVPADYLALEIRIESDEADWGLKLAGIEEARRLLLAAAQREKFQVRIDRALVFHPRGQKYSFAISGGGPAQHDAYSDILLLCPIDEQTDLVPLVQRMRSLVSDLKPGKKTGVNPGNLFLALDQPERHRAALLGLIRTHVETTARALYDAPAYTLTGLDEPLRLRQSGERHIDVYLPFRATYGRPAKE